MKTTVWSCVVFLVWGLSDSQAEAFYLCCPPPCCIAYEMRAITCYRPEWKEEKVPVTVEKVKYRKEVDKVKVKVYVAKLFDEKVQTSYYVPVPKVVEQDVATCVTVPIILVDPCSGCCYVSCRPQWATQKVKCTVYDYKVEKRDVSVKACKWVPEDRVVEQVRWVPEVTREQVMTVRRYCVPVAYQATICVPVYIPCCP